MTEMFGEAWPPMSVPDLAPDDDDVVTTSIMAASVLCIFRVVKSSDSFLEVRYEKR